MNYPYDPTLPRQSEYRDEQVRAARPRDAASLVIVRYRDTPEILMGKRAASHKFMPNKFVFPGGRLDVADQRLRVGASLQPSVLRKLREHTTAKSSNAKPTGLALAAIRETLEETGLIIGRTVAQQLKSKNPSWSRYFQHGVEPALDQLEFVARAITPSYRVRRFDTRFFMTDDESLYANGEDLTQASGELEEVGWFPLHEAVSLDLPGVTQWVLREVGERVKSSASERLRRPTFLLRFINGKTIETKL